jgi:hypothetical protein
MILHHGDTEGTEKGVSGFEFQVYRKPANGREPAKAERLKPETQS